MFHRSSFQNDVFEPTPSLLLSTFNTPINTVTLPNEKCPCLILTPTQNSFQESTENNHVNLRDYTLSATIVVRCQAVLQLTACKPPVKVLDENKTLRKLAICRGSNHVALNPRRRSPSNSRLAFHGMNTIQIPVVFSK